MIAYLPELYPDELAYSWFCRYYAHLRKEEHRLLYYCEGYAELCKLLKYLGKTNGL